DHGNAPAPRLALQALQELEATHPRHHEIDDDGGGSLLLRRLEPALAIAPAHREIVVEDLLELHSVDDDLADSGGDIHRHLGPLRRREAAEDVADLGHE